MSKLIYRRPAKYWKEALPLGNGKLAAMVYGGIKRETIAINDATLWSGYPRDYMNPNCAVSLNKARDLIFAGKYSEADSFVKNNMCGEYSESFLPLGNVIILTKSQEEDNYSRDLDIDHATFNVINGRDARHAFVSYPDNAMYYQMSFSTPTNATVKSNSPLKSSSESYCNRIVLSGFAPDRVVPNYVRTCLNPIKYNEAKGMGFVLLIQAESDGEITSKNGKINIVGATEILLKIVTETGFTKHNLMPIRNVKLLKRKAVDRISVLDGNYNDALARHIEDYIAIYSKHSLSICQNQNRTVSEILEMAKNGVACNELINLLYDYGKYLIIAGSRTSEPLNLQGQWNQSIRPPWSSNLTTNINFEMNYWAVSAVNLSECLAPFKNAVKQIADNGSKTAVINYGAQGFACNHNVDIWRMTTPVKGNPAYMHAPLCGMWLANELYSHEVTELGYAENDSVVISEKAACFALDYLVEHNGKFVTCPSASPEAEFNYNGKRCSLDYSSAFEMGIIKECFHNCLMSSSNFELKERINALIDNLYDFNETSTGINEWHDEKAIVEKGHRHFSPLYAFYPAHVIKYYGTPETRALVEKLFRYRMSNAHNSIGWSAAWAICLYARLHDADGARNIINGMLSKSIYPNLFGYHPPNYFQIDGNLGFIAGVNEMLFYVEDGIIDVLPACPKEWKDGKVIGHKINGATVSVTWANGNVTEILSDKPIKVNNANVAVEAKLTNVSLIKR